MTKEELAARLDGREYGSEMTEDEEAEAKEAGLLVIFGYSDDSIEFRGAFHVDGGEIGCFGGCKGIRFNADGLCGFNEDDFDFDRLMRDEESLDTAAIRWARAMIEREAAQPESEADRQIREMFEARDSEVEE